MTSAEIVIGTYHFEHNETDAYGEKAVLPEQDADVRLEVRRVWDPEAKEYRLELVAGLFTIEGRWDAGPNAGEPMTHTFDLPVWALATCLWDQVVKADYTMVELSATRYGTVVGKYNCHEDHGLALTDKAEAHAYRQFREKATPQEKATLPS